MDLGIDGKVALVVAGSPRPRSRHSRGIGCRGGAGDVVRTEP